MKSSKNYGIVNVISDRGQYSVEDNNGNIIVPAGRYAWISGFDSGLARVCTSGRSLNTSTVIVSCDLSGCYSGERLKQHVKEEFLAHPEKFEKWGIIDEGGNEVLPLEYDEIWKFEGKGKLTTKVIKSGISMEFSLRLRSFVAPSIRQEYIECCEDDEYGIHYSDDEKYGTHYGEYAGSYAQDVMGFSDEAIGDAFDGDPDCYWNID
jgi:hypothetical protein